LDDAQLLRYSRHILLNELGIEGQEQILAGHALVIGAGGLGCPAALYLASAGVGRLTLVDADTVDLTNLQRQILHTTDRVGELKVASARAGIAALNPEVEVATVAARAEGSALAELVAAANVVLDCSDNFATRYAVNRACVRHGKPLVSGAAIRFDGQIGVFDTRRPGAPCYHCLFPEEGQAQEEACATMGVFAPLTGIVGTVQAAEALKLLAGIGENLAGRLVLLNALTMQWHAVAVKRDPGCAVCGREANAP
jgi:molybdopterin/thiamine biosynthesis adenylyltransferase